MAGSGKSRANENKRIRQEALREQLAGKGLIQHVLEISNKLSDLTVILEPNDVVRLKASADIQKGLIAKYMPDLKSVEHTGEIDTGNANELTEEQIIARLAEIADGEESIRKSAKDKTSTKELH